LGRRSLAVFVVVVARVAFVAMASTGSIMCIFIVVGKLSRYTKEQTNIIAVLVE
jgi:hypothetical protein